MSYPFLAAAINWGISSGRCDRSLSRVIIHLPRATAKPARSALPGPLFEKRWIIRKIENLSASLSIILPVSSELTSSIAMISAESLLTRIISTIRSRNFSILPDSLWAGVTMEYMGVGGI